MASSQAHVAGGSLGDVGQGVAADRSNAYKLYVVFVIVVANIFNYADRTILSVLTQSIKQDLGISDAQMGFLFGTSYVLFHGLMGMAAAHLADAWLRHRLLGIGIAIWSTMTALSGYAQTYAQLAVARFGVGFGESTIGPVGHAILADLFPAKQRGRVFSLYLCGPFLGSALCIAGGGWLLGAWPDQCGRFNLCDIKGWQAAFFVFGLPGLLVSFLAFGMGEPVEPERRARTKPLVEGLRELSMLIPPFTLWRQAQLGGKRAVTSNIIAAVVIALIVTGLVALTKDKAQWTAVGFAAYAATSWVQALSYRDKQLYRLTVASPAFRAATLGMAMVAIVSASVGFWTIPLALRTFNISAHEAGTVLGIATGGGAFVGTILGGVLADWWRQRTTAAPLWIGIISMVGMGSAFALLATMESVNSYAIALALLMSMAGIWTAPIASLVQDLILPAMRARASVMFSLTLMLMSLSLGPYTVGRIADATGSLARGLGMLFVMAPFSIACLFYAKGKLQQAFAARAAVASELK